MLYSARRIAILFLVSSLFTLYFLLFTISTTFAQTPASAPNYQTNPYLAPNTSPDVPKNLHTWTQSVVIEVLSSATCLVMGVDPTSPHQKCLGVDPSSGTIGFVENGGGTVGLMGKMISVMYTPPIHARDGIHYLVGNFGFAKQAHAQGVGFQSLSPLTNLWKTFLNITYLIFVVVFVLIGFGIMLRIKIDPRTVMTLENQIPKIVIGLIIATFSLAIAGFLVDMMWVLTYLMFNLFGGIPNITPETAKQINDTQSSFHGKNIIWVFNDLVGFRSIDGAAGGVKDALTNMLGGQPQDPSNWWAGLGATITGGVIGLITGNIVGAVFGTILGGYLGYFSTGGLQQVAGSAAGFIAYLIIGIALFWALFRIWFELLKAYVMILINITLAPFWIVVGLIPGSPIGFGSWFRDLLANLLAFPVVIALFLMGKVFMEAFSVPSSTPYFLPPLIGNPGGPSVFGSLIGLGFVLLVPQAVAMTKEMVKSPQFKYTAGISQALSIGNPLNVGQQAGGLGSTLFGLSNVPGINKLPIISSLKGTRGAAPHGG